MTSLAAPFILCPISEIKDLVGFSQDAEENKVIVTLGKNIAIRYSVLEQKQEISWTSSSHWFTSKVVFCHDFGKYAAVIDDSCVGLWNEDDSNLIGLKKYKLSQPLHEVVPTSTLGSLLVFKNGHVVPLAEVVLHGRKADYKGFVDTNSEVILDVFIEETKFLAFVFTASKSSLEKNLQAKSKIGVEKQSNLTIHTLSLERSEDEKDVSILSSVVINPGSGPKIIGWCVVNSGDDSRVVYLCSNGTLMIRKLLGSDSDCEKSVKKISAFGKYVSTANPVVMCAYNETTIICYGSNKNEEGAIVFLYDLKYDLSLSAQALKLYSAPPIMAKISNSVLVPLGLNLLVVTINESNSLLSSVVGRNQIQGIDFFESRDPWKSGWEQKTTVQPLVKNVRTQDLHESMYDGIDLVDLQQIVSTLEKNGHPESLICGQVIPQALEKGDETALKWILEYFEDIPERLLVQLIPSSLATFQCKDSTESVDIDIANMTDQAGRQHILLTVLKRSFDKQEMVKCLKCLTYEDCQLFLNVLTKMLSSSFLLTERGKNVDENTVLVNKILIWISAVIDAQYTNLVFAGETESIDKMLKIINDKIALMKEIESLGPLVEVITNRTKYEPRPNPKSVYRVVKVIFR